MNNENSFYSIDRLVEFGMGMAMAQQMVKMMNYTMKDMYVPGTMNAMQPPQITAYYAMLDGNQAGPFSETELARLISEKKIVKETYIWKSGMPNWELAQNIPEVLKLVALAPPPFQATKQSKSVENPIKDEATTALQTLGFNKSKIEVAIDDLLKVNSNYTLEEIIKQAISVL